MNTKSIILACEAEASRRVQAVKLQFPGCERARAINDWTLTSISASLLRVWEEPPVNTPRTTGLFTHFTGFNISQYPTIKWPSSSAPHSVGDTVSAGAFVRGTLVYGIEYDTCDHAVNIGYLLEIWGWQRGTESFSLSASLTATLPANSTGPLFISSSINAYMPA